MVVSAARSVADTSSLIRRAVTLRMTPSPQGDGFGCRESLLEKQHLRRASKSVQHGPFAALKLLPKPELTLRRVQDTGDFLHQF